MSLNPHKLTKAQVEWLWDHRCKRHNMRYLEHPSCYEADGCLMGLHHRIGFLDIEATDLRDAAFGFVLSWSIKEKDGEIESGCIRPEEIRDFTFDRRIVFDCIEAIRRYDLIVTYNGDRTWYGYDIPFLLTRALHWKLPWPHYKEVKQSDLYREAKNILKLRRKSLERVCQLLEVPAKEHRLDPQNWQRAMAGDQDALDFVLAHNKEDVISLEDAWKRLIHMLPGTQRSL